MFKSKAREGRRTILSMAVLAASCVAMNASAQLDFSSPETLSAGNGASKTKLLRLGNGWLVAPFGDSAGPDVYDTKADKTRPARDIFVRACNSNVSSCSLASDWSAAVNLSNTANSTSISTDWDGDINTPAAPFYGDSDKPNIFAAGSFVTVTWVDKFCDADEQRMVKYIERDGITMPFSCVYRAYTNNVGSGIWTTERLTDGSRDAKGDVNKGLSVGTPAVGNWVISWQEDPHGLQLGGADGPGEGASGATVTHGTDVWYAYTSDLMSGDLSEPVRVTDNHTTDGGGGNANPVYDPGAPDVELENLEGGKTGAARPNLMLVAGSTPPTAVIAYEESKGADRTDSGKFVRYHNFPFNSPPTPGAGPGGIDGEPGCIISDPLENSRRVRFVAQSNTSPNGLRMGVFWRQGFPTEGGPADIMVRVGSSLSPVDMFPAVDGNCEAVDYEAAKLLANVPAQNLSSNTIPWTPVDACEVVPVAPPSNDLADTTSFNPYEDSRAHRAAIVGDDFYVGYSYVKDWAVSTYTDMDNYNFWMRRYTATGPGAGSWTTAMNVSNIDDPAINVKEPRLVKTPGTGPGCPVPADPADPTNTNPENCQNKNTLIVAWGTESNVYSHFQSSDEFDIWYTRTRDKAVTFEEPVVVPGIGANNRFESQLRPTPSGNIVYTVWNEADGVGTNAMVSVSDQGGVVPPPVDCDLFPEDPACVEPPVDCDLFPEDPSCVEPPAVELDMAAVSIPASVRTYTRNLLSADVLNTAEAGMQDGSVEFSNDQGFSIELAFSSLGASDSITLSTYWRASGVSTVNWTIVLRSSDGTVVEEQTAVTEVTGWVPW